MIPGIILTSNYAEENPSDVPPIEPVAGECHALCEDRETGEAFVCSLEIGHDGPCETWDEEDRTLVAGERGGD